jgi:DNA-binding NtrC family response regulator
MPSLCLIEDDPIMGESLSDRFQLEGFDLDWHTTAASAAAALRARRFDAVISDVRLPDASGADLFSDLRRDTASTPPFVFVTGYGSVDTAVTLLKQGAADYVTKPFDITLLVEKVRKVVDDVPIHAPLNDTPDESVAEQDGTCSGLLGVSRAIRALEQQAPRVAARARTVLITGESGSGKEILARHLHELAHPQEDAPFVAVNCGAIPETLMEAELFGHERGAFTGADRLRKGHFEQARGGTLFLDEVAELTPALQVKLLRALQDRRVRRLGGDVEIDVDLRLICATHRDLRVLVETSRFREDLYYRINVVHLRVPPLRERAADITWLANRMLDQLSKSLEEPRRSLAPSARAALLAHPWPGNVRELQNRLERACVMTSHMTLTACDLFELDQETASRPEDLPSLEAFVAEAETSYLRAVLSRCEGRVGQAAALLHISRKTLWEKSRRYGLRAQD